MEKKFVRRKSQKEKSVFNITIQKKMHIINAMYHNELILKIEKASLSIKYCGFERSKKILKDL